MCIRDSRGGDQRRPHGQVGNQGRGQEIVQTTRPRIERQHAPHDGDGQYGLEQTVAQLHEVLHKGLFAAGELVFFFGISQDQISRENSGPGKGLPGAARRRLGPGGHDEAVARAQAHGPDEDGPDWRSRTTRAAPERALARLLRLRTLYHCGTAVRLARQFLLGLR